MAVDLSLRDVALAAGIACGNLNCAICRPHDPGDTLPPLTCQNPHCDRVPQPTIGWLCAACRQYLRRTGRERPARLCQAPPPRERILTRFGLVLRSHMDAQNLSQYRLAARAGLNTGHISRLLVGKRHPRRSTVMALAAALDLQGDERRRLLTSAGYWEVAS